MEALDKSEARDLVELHDGRKLVGSKWVFKKKLNATRNIEKFKAQLVAKGYFQVEVIDFGEIFSPIAKLTSIRFVWSLATIFKLEVEKMDVKTMFLHHDIDE